MIEVNSRSFDGSVRKSWRCELIEQRDQLVLAVGVFETEVHHPDLGHIKIGTVSYEFFWLDRWYNIFRFHEPSGELRNYYGNICMPPTFENGVLDYVDLDIDVLIFPGAAPVVLDREEYEVHAEAFGYPPDVRGKVAAALQELLELFERREMPELFCNLPTDPA